MKRRMAAILVADIVGFSSLMEADEDGTALRLATCRHLIDEEIAKCDGRLFKAMGDAVLVEFPSPIQAVRCAVDIRTGLALAAQNEQRPIPHALRPSPRRCPDRRRGPHRRRRQSRRSNPASGRRGCDRHQRRTLRAEFAGLHHSPSTIAASRPSGTSASRSASIACAARGIDTFTSWPRPSRSRPRRNVPIPSPSRRSRSRPGTKIKDIWPKGSLKN